MKTIVFLGDELELLNALDRSGCVLTDEGKFYCNMENDKLPMRITGTYTREQDSWKITYRVTPALRIAAIGGVFAALFLFGLFTFIRTGTATSALLFGVLSAALLANFLSQKENCLQRFENTLLLGNDI